MKKLLGILLGTFLVFAIFGFVAAENRTYYPYGMGMMSSWNNTSISSFGWFMFAFMWVFMLLILVALVLFIVWLIKQIQHTGVRR